jgi:DNA-binding CsgD family transcriptional regulator
MVLFRLFDTELLSGRWDRADSCAARMSELAEPSGVSREYARLAHALVDAHRGQLGHARTAARAGLEFAEASGERPLAHHNQALLGLIELSQSEPARAADELLRWEAVVRELDFRDPYHLLRGAPNEAEALTEAGRLDEAERVLDWFEQAAREAGRAWPSVFVARGRGLLHAAAGETDAALALLEPLPASEHLAALPFERARTLLLLGVVLRRDKRRRDAREALVEAQAVFAALGAAAWEARTSAEVARIGGRTPSGDELTVSERRIAERVAAGKQNKEVAAELFVSVSTVEAALTRIYAKLGVRSRTELAALLATLKL